MNKKIKIRLFTLVLLLCLIIPTAYAYMIQRTEKKENQFEIAIATNEVVEEVKENTKESIKIKNTGNIKSYIRLIIATHWEDTKGNIVGRQDKNEVNNGNPILSFDYNSQDWIKDGNIYYCKRPIEVDGLTPELLEEGSTITLGKVEKAVTNNGITVIYEYYQVVEIIGESIQANPKTSVIESWNVSLDTEGNIASVN